MYVELFREKGEKTIESVADAFIVNFGEVWEEYKTMDGIEKAEKNGWIEFTDGEIILWAEEN